MEMQEPALNSQSKVLLDDLESSLSEVYQVDEIIPDDMQVLLDRLDSVDFCREVALDLAGQRLCRLLSNTANQLAQ
jgi:hypothetical protein